MKWKNLDTGAGYYDITGTFVEWLPMLNNAGVRDIVCEEIGKALDGCGGCVSAFVLMPDHVHLLVYLSDGGHCTDSTGFGVQDPLRGLSGKPSR